MQLFVLWTWHHKPEGYMKGSSLRCRARRQLKQLQGGADTLFDCVLVELEVLRLVGR
jgi:hypothetical protein